MFCKSIKSNDNDSCQCELIFIKKNLIITRCQHSGHIDGSPFPSSQSMASPAASNWPGSPSVPRPSPARPGQSPSHVALHSPQASDHKTGSHMSRVLPPRSWAGAVPTLLTHEALESLCCASPHPSGLPGPDMSPLERFLGCVYMRRQLQRFIQTDDCVRELVYKL